MRKVTAIVQLNCNFIKKTNNGRINHRVGQIVLETNILYGRSLSHTRPVTSKTSRKNFKTFSVVFFRCQASCVALTTAIALMLQRSANVLNADGSFNVKMIIKLSYEEAAKLLTTSSEVNYS